MNGMRWKYLLYWTVIAAVFGWMLIGIHHDLSMIYNELARIEHDGK